MTKLETFLEIHAAKKADQKARMSNAYNRNVKLIESRKIPYQTRLERKYKKWAKENYFILDEESKTKTFKDMWTNIVNKFN
tara:strand:+ start:13 stop:255 length:243 start_codon:yes stop_codon:yes gene_type:complete